jgi:hypothetical protein
VRKNLHPQPTDDTRSGAFVRKASSLWVLMASKEDLGDKVSALRIRYQKSAAWKISALEAADSMKETVAIAFMSEDDAGALEMIEAMMEKYGELSDFCS